MKSGVSETVTPKRDHSGQSEPVLAFVCQRAGREPVEAGLEAAFEACVDGIGDRVGSSGKDKPREQAKGLFGIGTGIA